jgi:hypothetical protein
VAIENEFSDYGLLRGFNKICGECCRELKRKKKGSTKFNDDGEQSCDEDVVGSDDESGDDAIGENNTCEKVYSVICAKKHAGMPVGTLFLDLFQGAIPDVLDGLTMVEHSMISLYSNLTRITIQAGLHYHAKPTVYTVVNDLTAVVKQLPNFADVNAIIVYRHLTFIFLNLIIQELIQVHLLLIYIIKGSIH